MKRILASALLPLLVACSKAPAGTIAAAGTSDMKTIETTDPRPAVLDPPPMLRDEAPPPRPKVMPWQTETPVIMTPEDEKLRATLPFSPAIAMDPVDGSKISIRATTPVLKYKNKIYFFSSETNKRAFVATPDQFTKGAFSHL